MLRTSTYLIICLLLQTSLFAQSPPFKRISNKLGLSQNLITCITQDQQGFLWVGTRDGLNRFDGYEFKAFHTNSFDSTSISDNFIKSIFEDREGRLWIGTLKGLNLFDREKEIFYRILPEAGNLNSLSHQEINTIIQDKQGAIWTGTNGGGVNRIMFTTGVHPPDGLMFTHIRKPEGLASETVGLLVEDAAGTIWTKMRHVVQRITPTVESGVFKVEDFGYADLDESWRDQMSVNQYIENQVLQDDDRIYTLFNGANGTIWLAMAPGFVRWDPSTGQYDYFPAIKRFENGTFLLDGIAYGRGIEASDGHLWVGGLLAMAIYDPGRQEFLKSYHSHSQHAMNEFYPAVQHIFEDRGKTIWLGTNGYGLFKQSPQSNRFDNFIVDSPENSGSSIRSIFELRNGRLLIGMANSDLVSYDRATGATELINLHAKGQFRLQPIYDIFEDSTGGLWIGSGGLYHFPDAANLEKPPEFYPLLQHSAPNSPVINVFDIHQDSHGVIWLLTNESFGPFDLATGFFNGKSYLPPEIGSHNLSNFPCIYQEPGGNFWLGTVDGLKHYNPGTGIFTAFRNDPKNPGSLSHNVIRCIAPDPEIPHIMWIGTAGGGLNKLDNVTGKFDHYLTEQGLPDNVVYGILTDESGNLWMSTNKGISRFNPKTEDFRNYTIDDGLQDNEFNSCAYFKSRKGELFFGGINGFNAFFPNQIQDNPFRPPIVITDLQLFNKSVAFQTHDSPLKRPISETSELELSWKDKVFSLEFAALDFSSPEKNEFAFQMEGFDEGWHYIGNRRSVTFTNLDAGKYVFRVAGTNNDGVWNSDGTSLKITIRPPWWATWWAFAIYFGLIIGGLLLLYRLILNRQLEKAEAARLIELDAIKNRLYTNITHEFRTPLTVILGLAREINGNDRAKELILRNGDNLLQLINQMLDLAKMENGNLNLELQPVEVIQYLQYLTESFHSLAAAKNIQLTFYSECESLVLETDEEKLQHIVFNLLSNAIKYTPPQGRIVLHTRKINLSGTDYLQIKVWDNGTGIPREDLSRIFDRFYRVEEDSDEVRRQYKGTGIGLSFVKELVNMMGGTITVSSEAEKGTAFLVHLPARRAAEQVAVPEPRHEPSPVRVETVTPPPFEPLSVHERPVLLLIEDNLDVISYIRFLLQKQYNMLVAHNGEEGINLAFEHIPDIIISDVMMPVMDGFEVTEVIRKDERTSHIPIILLTAKANQEDKLTGLRKGADAYLMKPFNKDELYIRLEKLVSLREALQKKYASSNFLNKLASSKPTVDDLFLQKLSALVVERIDDPELSVTDLRQEVNLSQTQFYRKLKALTGQSPIHFIRIIRLQHANNLLQTTTLNISEIAYAVGFNDPNYFSRVFQNEMGHSPSEARKLI